MDVSVCIVNWNTRDLLCRCIESIYAKTLQVDYEVVVVDNASSDGSAAVIAQRFPGVKLVASSENLGFAKGCNLAVSYATGKYVLYLNPDTELQTNCIRGMKSVFEERPDVGAVGCRLLNADGSIQLTCASAFPSPRNELCSLLALDKLFPKARLLSSRELRFWDHLDSRDVECLSGACIMLPRDLIDRLGGLDTNLFMYGEDLDLCLRVGAQGLRLHYLASEIVYHREAAGSAQRGQHFAALRQRAANVYFLSKHWGKMRAAAYRAAVLGGASLRLLSIGLVWPLLSAMGHQRRSAFGQMLERSALLALWAAGLRRAETT